MTKLVTLQIDVVNVNYVFLDRRSNDQLLLKVSVISIVFRDFLSNFILVIIHVSITTSCPVNLHTTAVLFPITTTKLVASEYVYVSM